MNKTNFSFRILSIAIALCSITATAAPWDVGGPSRHNSREAQRRHQPPPGDNGWVRPAPPPRNDNRGYPPPRDDNRGYQPPRNDNRGYQPPPGRSNHGRWQNVGELSAGSAKEVSFGGSGYSECKIEVIEGSVSFNSVVIRRGGQKQQVKVVTRFNAGQSFSVPIDGAATGLRISESGRGRYRVLVK